MFEQNASLEHGLEVTFTCCTDPSEPFLQREPHHNFGYVATYKPFSQECLVLAVCLRI